MAQNGQIIGNIQGLQYQPPDGDGVEDDNIHPSTEAQESGHPITTPGDNDYELILPHFKAHIPEKVTNGEYGAMLGVQPREIDRCHQRGEDIERALLYFINGPNNNIASRY